jgi:hypothetical protein
LGCRGIGQGGKMTNFFVKKLDAIDYKKKMVRETRQKHTVAKTRIFLNTDCDYIDGYTVKLSIKGEQK